MTIRKHGTKVGIQRAKYEEYRTVQQKGGRGLYIPEEEMIEVCNNCPYDECRFSDHRTIMQNCYRPYMEARDAGTKD